MKFRYYIFLLLLPLSISLHAQSEDKDDKKEGDVKVYQDDAIKNLIGAPNNAAQDQGDSTLNDGSERNGNISDHKRGNYRIQVYSGYDPKKSKNEATYKRGLVKSRFPELSVDIKYEAPAFKVRAGHYPSKADAESALRALKGAFPEFSRDMYVVRVTRSR
ncbi:hypothetical protein M2132_002045 [Dysgonomonas sp. PH5-45]|uniref:SPOR domain-containing protein n=1 Tax=unclassified Dysgonomonas TaxID=2630389 RepID=UPI002476D373|nr:MULTISPECIES: SPOR domain-containing protein [unclassified Dysgonomonas]MDH6355699.1 hypothetical protein [Dysgonomonas sp. PH5-45]MDH6388596.1 hypothetical protein [Dysgonomonas sp. PH5-37]